MDSTRLRNIGIIAHIDAGKTTTTERMLFFSGINHTIGEVDTGTTTMDWMAQEQDRGITITSAATTIPWNSYTINLIDTPGHIDFTAEVERSLRVLDGAVTILCAVGGVEAQTETVWRQSNAYAIPRIVYVNKMDRIGADFDNVCTMMREKLNCNPLPLQIPIGSEDSFEAVIDLLDDVELHWKSSEPYEIERKPIRSEHIERAKNARIELLENLSEYNDELAILYLEGHEISNEFLIDAIRKATLDLQIIPVFVGASLRNIGVQPILDAVCRYLPSPHDKPEFSIVDPNTQKEKTLNAFENKELLALVFKIQYDREAGRICFVRIYSGTLSTGNQVCLASNKKKERVTRVFRIHANRQEQLRALSVGDIGAVVGCKSAMTGDTISLKPPSHVLESMQFPDPVITSSIETKTYSQRKDLESVLAVLASEDPTFSWKNDLQSGQLIILGMGELHLEVICKRIQDDFNISVRLGHPHVQLRETILHDAEGEFDETITLSGKEYPIALSIALKKNNAVGVQVNHSLEHLPEEVITASIETISGYLESGISFGYPGIQIEAIIKKMEIDKEQYSLAVIQSALVQCLEQVCKQAGEQLLEPIVNVNIVTPKEYLGEVTQSIIRRGGTIHSIESQAFSEQINAEAPLRIMFGYTTALRSATQGRGTASMHFSHFAPKPDTD